MSQEAVELARRYVEEFNARGLDGTQHLRHPDWELEDPPELPDAGRYSGEVAARTRIESFMQVGWDGKFRDVEYVDAGDEVVVVWQMTGEARGMSLEQRFAFIFRFDVGKLRQVRQFTTKDQALKAAGLLK